MSFKNLFLSGTTLGVLAVGFAPYVYAQDVSVRSVKDKMRDNYLAKGGRFGTFSFKPSLRLEQKIDDNVYRENNNEDADIITVLEPSVVVESDWNIHALSAGAKGVIGRYYDHENEGYEDHNVFLSGRYDLVDGMFLSAELRSDHSHLDRADIDNVDSDEPIEFDAHSASLGFTRAMGILKLYLNADLTRYTYENSISSGLGGDNSIRDHDQAALSAMLSYELYDDLDMFTQVHYDRRKYDVNERSFKDSSGYSMRVGLEKTVADVLSARGYIGYIAQGYDLGDVNAFDIGGAMVWNTSDETSLIAQLDRRVLETVESDASGIVSTSATLGLEHALKNDLLVDGYVSIKDHDYDGLTSASSYDNITYSTGLGVEYHLSRYMRAALGYDYTKRFAESAGYDYTNHEMRLSVNYDY